MTVWCWPCLTLSQTLRPLPPVSDVASSTKPKEREKQEFESKMKTDLGRKDIAMDMLQSKGEKMFFFHD